MDEGMTDNEAIKQAKKMSILWMCWYKDMHILFLDNSLPLSFL